MQKSLIFALAIAGTLVCVTTVMGSRKPSRVTAESLLSVVTPVHKGTSSAHPWINVRVRFGAASDGSEADRETFKAWLGSCRLPSEVFDDVVIDGVVVEKRVRLPDDRTRCHLKKGIRPRNRLRFKVRASGTTKMQRRLKDVDQVRLAVTDGENHPPEPILSIDSDVIRPNVEVSFSAAGSHDPDEDWLTYEWNFGDSAGTTAAGETATHRYTESRPVKVTLRASDGDESTAVERSLPAIPALDSDRTEGTLGLSASSDITLDFDAVPVGQSDTRTFTVHNTDSAADVADSQIKFTVEALGGGGAFTADCPPTETACDLGPGEQREVTVTFTPTAEANHAEAVLQLLATARNRSRVDLFTHGYGEGTEPTGRVPWETAHTAFYMGFSGKVFATKPDGTVTEVDVGTGSCQGGSLDGAPCVADGNCPGAACGPRVCLGGTSHGSACSNVSDCPSGACGQPFDPIDLCADGRGSVFLLNDDAHEDPNWEREPPRTGMILRAALDGSRSVVTDAVTEQSMVLACDRSAGGRVFWAQYDIYGEDWDDREQLMSIKKDGTSTSTHVTNISQRLGDVDPESYIDPADGYVYFEESTGLRVTADGRTRYVVNGLGLYRLNGPTDKDEPLVITRSYYCNTRLGTRNFFDEQFALFPDGSILVADVTEDSTRSTLRLYKIDPNNALNGAVQLDDITPWATMGIPNNRGSSSSGFCQHTAHVNSLAVDPDGIVFVNVRLGTELVAPVVPTELRLKGTARFQPREDGTSGIYTGFVNLDVLGALSF